MARFQSQGQWENESQTISGEVLVEVSEQEEQTGTRSFPLKKALLLIFILFLVGLAVIFTIYSRGRSIEGVWVRQADENTAAEGMVVEVTRNGSAYEGKVIKGSKDPTEFKEGQIKWFQLRKVGFGEYEGFDLTKNYLTQTYYYEDFKFLWTVQPGGEWLSVESPKNRIGSHQLWLKQKND